jgi:hypothetical protein
MHRMKQPTYLLSALLMSASVAFAAPVVLEQPLPALTLQDQHTQPWGVKSDTRLVVFAAGRKPSNLVMEVLGAQAKGFLESRQAMYVADMSRMPGFVTRTFALPALREQPFAVGVNLDDKQLADWPRQEDAITLIRLESGRVSSIAYARTAAELKTALGITTP